MTTLGKKTQRILEFSYRSSVRILTIYYCNIPKRSFLPSFFHSGLHRIFAIVIREKTGAQNFYGAKDRVIKAIYLYL